MDQEQKKKFFTILYVVLILLVIVFVVVMIIWINSESATCMQDPISYYTNKTGENIICTRMIDVEKAFGG